MCLDLRTDSKKRYASKNNIRYKVLLKRGEAGKQFIAPVMGTRYTAGKWRKAVGVGQGPASYGFHVFMTKKGAEEYRNDCVNSGSVVEVRVKGFLRSGYTGYYTIKTETYKHMKVIGFAK